MFDNGRTFPRRNEGRADKFIKNFQSILRTGQRRQRRIAQANLDWPGDDQRRLVLRLLGQTRFLQRVDVVF